MALHHFLGYLMAHQGFKGIFSDQGSGKPFAVEHGQMQLNDFAARCVDEGLGVGGLVAFSGLHESLMRFGRRVQGGVLICLVFQRVTVH